MNAVSPKSMAAYVATARRRQQARKAQLQQRRDLALATAQAIARWLYEKMGATRVVAFGSVLDPSQFDETSDIDLAVWGLSPDTHWHVLTHLMASPELTSAFQIDVVPAETAAPYLQAEIAQGQPL